MTAEIAALFQTMKVKRPRKVNWPLVVGLIIVAGVCLVALVGPYLAPQDPTQQTFIVEVGDRYWQPPFPFFKIPGFPLGSDQFGRDLLSRILWGVRPTLLMVLPVALVRLLLGMLIGLISGFSESRAGRLLEGLISIALAIPVLLVALGGIALVGAKHGVIAFIFGLALNGWAETARYVQEQTRLIKQQPYMEAARAMGGSTGDMLIRHVLRQIMPAVWMMLAFEISGTMLVSAELGFLGYYIGGGMWIEVQDFVAVNITDLPELGQMLGTALVNITRPETLLVTGGMIFIVILGFNLLGDGLRTRLQVDRIEPSSFLSDLGERLNIWLDAITPQQDTPRWRWGVVFLVADLTAAMALACWLLVHLPAVVQVPKPAAVPLANTSPHPWPMERHDPQGTLYTPIVGPQNPAIRWIFQDAAGFVGGPVVAKDGTIYQLSKAQLLYALSPQGKVLRQVPLDEPPVGSPALGKGGVIYVVGSKGGISAYKPDGSRLWVLPSPAGIATSGPVVASDGTIYYAIIDTVRAVSPEGVLVGFWQIAKSMSDYPPRLSPDGQWLLLHEAGASRTGGTPLDTLALKDDTAQFSDPNFVVGADGFVYYRTGHGLTRMQVTGNIAESLARVSWDPKGIIQAYPADAGVSPNGWAWLLYSDEYSDTEIIWIHTGSLTVKILRLPVRGLRVVGVDQQDTLYGCTRSFAQSTCYALRQDKTKPLWSLDLENTDRLAGAALLEGTLYVATQDGTLYALEDPQP